jgi:hypothetical protein
MKPLAVLSDLLLSKMFGQSQASSVSPPVLTSNPTPRTHDQILVIVKTVAILSVLGHPPCREDRYVLQQVIVLVCVKRYTYMYSLICFLNIFGILYTGYLYTPGLSVQASYSSKDVQSQLHCNWQSVLASSPFGDSWLDFALVGAVAVLYVTGCLSCNGSHSLSVIYICILFFVFLILFVCSFSIICQAS